MKRLFFLAVVLVCLSSCTRSFTRIEDYLKWLHNSDNGFLKEKMIGDKKITVKYLTPEYLTYQELKDVKCYTQHMKDSLLELYSKNRTFLLTIAPKDDKDGNIMMEDVKNYNEYSGKVIEMNFELSKYIQLQTKSKSYTPVLTNMENTYGLQKHKNIFIVFSKEHSEDDLLDADELDFTFNDELFSTGINHFVYTKKNLDQKVSTNFWTIKETL